MSDTENYYDNGPSTQIAKAPAEAKSASNSTLIPRSLCGEVEPGDTVTLRVEEVRGDQLLVSRCGGESESEPEAPEDSEMSSMMS